MSSAPIEMRCAVHPEQVAEGACARCGNYACSACNVSTNAARTLCTQCGSLADESRYHVVPVWRFVLFSVLTHNAYPVYWFWKNWSQIKRCDNSDIWPIPRAVFGGFTYFMLLTDINTQFVTRGSTRSLTTALGVGFLVCGALYRLPKPYELLSLLACLFVIPAVHAIRELASEAAIRKSGWSTRHTVALIPCILVFILALAGSYRN